MKDAHHGNQCLKQCQCICARDCTSRCLVSISAICHSRQETLSDDCMCLSSDRNKSSHRLCSGADAGNALARDQPSENATLRLGCSLAVRCVSASTLLVAIATQHISDQTLLRIGSAKWRTLQLVMFEKNLCCFLRFFIPEMLSVL